MELTENEYIERYAKQIMHCTRNLLLPNEYEWSCIPCGYVIKRKNELTKNSTKKITNRWKYSEEGYLVFAKTYLK